MYFDTDVMGTVLFTDFSSYHCAAAFQQPEVSTSTRKEKMILVSCITRQMRRYRDRLRAVAYSPIQSFPEAHIERANSACFGFSSRRMTAIEAVTFIVTSGYNISFSRQLFRHLPWLSIASSALFAMLITGVCCQACSRSTLNNKPPYPPYACAYELGGPVTH